MTCQLQLDSDSNLVITDNTNSRRACKKKIKQNKKDEYTKQDAENKL